MKCSVAGCDKPFCAKGLCHTHYVRYWKHGDPTITKRPNHGLSKTSEYVSWNCMMIRCYYSKNKNYEGRGIIVCDRWKNSFMAFYEDMGKKPDPEYQIHRIDHDGNYEPGNCQWIKQKINAQNNSRVKLNLNKANKIRKLYEIGKHTRRELGKLFGIHHATVGYIVRNEIWI